MIKNKYLNINMLMLLFLFILSIMPYIHIGTYGIPVLYLLLPIAGFFFLLIIFKFLEVPKITHYIIFFFLSIFIQIFISAFYGTISRLNVFEFPSDILQYVARFLTLIFFIILFYKRKVNIDFTIKLLLIFYSIGMLIGVLQWLPWFGREFFIELYPFRDGSLQLSHLNRDLRGIRVHGIAQMATANGGLATFFLVFALSVLKYYGKYKKLSILLIILSITNVFASQARAGILALVFSIMLFYIIDIYINRRKVIVSIRFLSIICLIGGIVYFLYLNGNQVIGQMVSRWINLFETDGGARIDQIEYFFSYLNTPMDYLFGLSKPFINQSSISYGVEIEPINIYITYGILGFILQYSLIIYLCFYFFKGIKESINDKAILTLLISSLIGLLSYQVFSSAYYFFRELRVGLFPWILMGITIGAFEKYKRSNMKQ